MCTIWVGIALSSNVTINKKRLYEQHYQSILVTFLGLTEHFSGRNGALRWSILKLSKTNLSSFPAPSSIIYRYNSKAANLPVYCFGILTLIYSLNYLLATPGNRSKISMTNWNHLKLLLVRCYKFHSEQIIINH